jgi:hypothetical protein
MMSMQDLSRTLETEAGSTRSDSNTGTACGPMWMPSPGLPFLRGDVTQGKATGRCGCSSRPRRLTAVA